MKNEVENYIDRKMKRGIADVERAGEQVRKGNMKGAVYWYYSAMLSFYECAKDLIDGTGFKEAKGGEK